MNFHKNHVFFNATDKHHVFNYALVREQMMASLLGCKKEITVKNRITDAYVITLYDRKDIAKVRSVVKKANKMLKKTGIHSGYNVDVKGRLGHNNPNRDKYNKRWGPTRIALDDAQRFDVYLYYKVYDEERYYTEMI